MYYDYIEEKESDLNWIGNLDEKINKIETEINQIVTYQISINPTVPGILSIDDNVRNRLNNLIYHHNKLGRFQRAMAEKL